MADAETLVAATGRRKESVCRAQIRPGSGRWEINNRPLEEYFASTMHRMLASEPLRIARLEGQYDVVAKVTGGGVSGQAGALRQALAKALAEMDPELRTTLKKAGLLTRDAREKERRKYGLKKARKAPQYSKR
ncbi:MAG: 30S ribosomal protein S9 [Actinomycetota bacterium]|nr:30S ribosomal protein S9 [Actinomycetota bacterium]